MAIEGAQIIVDFGNWTSILGFAASTLGTAMMFTWWFSRQMDSIKTLVRNQGDDLKEFFTEKLEYHEKHDDIRFNAIHNDIWDIRIRNAAKDGYTPNYKSKIATDDAQERRQAKRATSPS